MEQNRDPAGMARVEGETPSSPASGSQQPPQQGYVPPELRPSGPSYTGSGEPTRRWSEPPPQPPSQPATPMASQTLNRDRPRHTPILGPVLLIGAGIVFLLINMGVLDENVWAQLLQLWPLLLIAIGLDLLLGRRNPALSLLVVLLMLAVGAAIIYANGGFGQAGNVAQRDLNVPLNGAKSAYVRIDLGIATLTVDAGDTGTSQLATGKLEYYQDQREPVVDVTPSGDTVQLRLSQRNSRGNWWPFSRSSRDLNWDVHLNPDVPMKLDVNTGTGSVDLDMSDLKVTGLSLDSGTGSSTLIFPSNAGTTTASINGGVGSIELEIPREVEARITVKTGIGGVDVDERFAKQGDNVYQSKGYSSSAKNKLDLTVNAGVGSVDIVSR